MLVVSTVNSSTSTATESERIMNFRFNIATTQHFGHRLAVDRAQTRKSFEIEANNYTDLVRLSDRRQRQYQFAQLESLTTAKSLVWFLFSSSSFVRWFHLVHSVDGGNESGWKRMTESGRTQHQ